MSGVAILQQARQMSLLLNYSSIKSRSGCCCCFSLPPPPPSTTSAEGKNVSKNGQISSCASWERSVPCEKFIIQRRGAVKDPGRGAPGVESSGSARLNIFQVLTGRKYLLMTRLTLGRGAGRERRKKKASGRIDTTNIAAVTSRLKTSAIKRALERPSLFSFCQETSGPCAIIKRRRPEGDKRPGISHRLACLS